MQQRLIQQGLQESKLVRTYRFQLCFHQLLQLHYFSYISFISGLKLELLPFSVISFISFIRGFSGRNYNWSIERTRGGRLPVHGTLSLVYFVRQYYGSVSLVFKCSATHTVDFEPLCMSSKGIRCNILGTFERAIDAVRQTFCTFRVSLVFKPEVLFKIHH